MTGLSSILTVNVGFIRSEGVALRPGGRSTIRPPKIGARLSGMAQALHRARRGEGVRIAGLARICALLSWEGVWGQTVVSPRLHDCLRPGVGGLCHG